jgi:hypothetical protein
MCRRQNLLRRQRRKRMRKASKHCFVAVAIKTQRLVLRSVALATARMAAARFFALCATLIETQRLVLLPLRSVFARPRSRSWHPIQSLRIQRPWQLRWIWIIYIRILFSLDLFGHYQLVSGRFPCNWIQYTLCLDLMWACSLIAASWLHKEYHKFILYVCPSNLVGKRQMVLHMVSSLPTWTWWCVGGWFLVWTMRTMKRLQTQASHRFSWKSIELSWVLWKPDQIQWFERGVGLPPPLIN